MIEDEVKEILKQEMDKQGIKDNYLRAGLAAIIGGESNFKPKWETSWKNTSNDRIKRFFSRLRTKTDDELDYIKADDVRFFDAVYGGRYGNDKEGDGYRYRGGGLIQLTFKDNYKQIGEDIGVDLINHPELIVSDIKVSVAAAVAYMKRHYKGEGDNFNQMKAAVGVSMGEPNEIKNKLYYQYKNSGEFNYKGLGGEAKALDSVVVNFLASLQELEKFLKARGLYSGAIDNDPGPGVREGLKSYLNSI